MRRDAPRGGAAFAQHDRGLPPLFQALQDQGHAQKARQL